MNKKQHQIIKHAITLTRERQAELRDLTRLAIDRARDAMGLTGQLLDNNILYAAVLTTVASDMLLGATVLFQYETKASKEECLDYVMTGLLERLEENLKQSRGDVGQ